MAKEIIPFSYKRMPNMAILEFVINGRPITKKNNPMVVPDQAKRVLPSKQFSLYQKEAKKQLKPQMEACWFRNFPILELVVVEAKYWMPHRGSWPDYTGLIQATGDILQHVKVLNDDSQIITFGNSWIAGIDPENPRAEIKIYIMESNTRR